MSPNPKLIEAILTNNKLTETEKSNLIAEFIENLEKEYPELKYHATKSDVKEAELKLTKEIEEIRKEIKELDIKLTKEIKEVELKLTKEIEEIRKEIKELDIRLIKEVEKSKFSMIKWSFLFWISQFSAILILIYKILKG